MKKCAAAVLILLFVCCSKKMQKESESNDDFASANLVLLDSGVEGTLSTASDVDCFRFRVDSECAVSFTLSPLKGINHSLSVYSLSGASASLVKTSDDARKSSPEQLVLLRLTSGEYIAEVRHGERDEKKGDPDSRYFLEMKTSGVPSGCETEPNDSAESANLIKIGDEAVGYFSPAINRNNRAEGKENREEDWYFFDAECSENLPLILDIDLQVPENINGVIELYSPDKVLLGVYDNAQKGGTESVMGRGFTVAGRYYLVVYSKGLESSSGEYYLKIHSREFDPSVELEPNNVFENANTAGESVKGVIYPGSDVDCYYYADAGEGFYSIELQSSSKLNLKMKIFDRSFRQLYQVDSQGAGQPEIFPNFRSAEPFYVSVASSGAASGSDEYILNVKRYELEATSESEPNDDMKKANSPVFPVKGCVSYAGDKDYFLLSSPGRKLYKFKIKGVSGCVLNVSVCDSLGFKIRELSVKYDSEVKFSETVDGRGYLVIQSDSSPSPDNYIITLEN